MALAVGLAGLSSCVDPGSVLGPSNTIGSASRSGDGAAAEPDGTAAGGAASPIERTFHYTDEVGWEYDATVVMPPHPISVDVNVTHSPPGRARLRASVTELELDFVGTLEGREAPSVFIYDTRYVWVDPSILKFPAEDRGSTYDPVECTSVDDDSEPTDVLSCIAQEIQQYTEVQDLAEGSEDYATAVVDFVEAHPTPVAAVMRYNGCDIVVPYDTGKQVRIVEAFLGDPAKEEPCAEQSVSSLR